MIIELHAHTNASDAVQSVEETIRFAETKVGALAITDHNTFGGYYKSRQIKTDLLVIPGIEVSTDCGHIVGLGIEELKFKEKEDACSIIDKIHSSGGTSIAAHPYRIGLGLNTNEGVLKRVNAIEVLNGNTPMKYNRRARKTAEELKKPMTCGSDAHRIKDIGRFSCETKATNIDGILKAVRKGDLVLSDKTVKITSLISKVIYRRMYLTKRKMFGNPTM
ncbi:CehA/McbA family metallohydrolase [Candidatus Aenigmatarchaeota archaeon]